jgi:probable selenium-dependent hydroxylase accessory protein YqeC
MGLLRRALQLERPGMVAIVGAGGKTSLMFRLAAELSAAGESVLTTTTTRIFMPGEDESRCVAVGGSVDRILEAARALPAGNRHLTAAAGTLEGGSKLKGFAPDAVEAIAASGRFDWILVEADGAAGRPLKAPAAHEPVIPASAKVVVAVAGLRAMAKPLTGEWVFRPERFAALSGAAPGGVVDAADVAAVLAHPDGGLKGAPAHAKVIVFLNQADDPADFRNARRIAERLPPRPPGRIGRVVAGRLRRAPIALEVIDL